MIIMKKTVYTFIIIMTVFLMITACAAGPNEALNVASPDNLVIAGFWRGLWHGIIAPFTFFISLFTDKINLYEVHNNGGWYDFGFVIGAGIIFGGGGRASRKRRG
jgi:hypothetical protein